MCACARECPGVADARGPWRLAGVACAQLLVPLGQSEGQCVRWPAGRSPCCGGRPWEGVTQATFPRPALLGEVLTTCLLRGGSKGRWEGVAREESTAAAGPRLPAWGHSESLWKVEGVQGRPSGKPWPPLPLP